MDGSPSWYLDPLVASQKRDIHQRWVRSAVGHRSRGTVLKTDVFEEAYGADRIFNDLFPGVRLAIGMDLNPRTAHAAAVRNGAAFRSIACDVRHLALPAESMDVVVSMSTLDHFDSAEDIGRSLDEIARVLRRGGTLAITLDNPRNLLYHIVRWSSRRGWTPFRLGATVSLRSLTRMLAERGLRVQATAYLIHNPRGISTALFLALRRIFGRFAAPLIPALLAMFSAFGKLPTRSLTGCFFAVAAVKE